MTTVLHIDSSARQVGSVTRRLSATVVERLNPSVLIRRDLSNALPQIDEAWVDANFTPQESRTPEQTAALALSDQLVSELQAADTIVIGAPVYNFGVPASLKLWIDLIARAGVTFRYTANGPVGLLDGKRVVIALASGGTKAGSDIDFASTYLRHVLGFVGIIDVDLVSADQMGAGADESLARANEAVDRLAA